MLKPIASETQARIREKFSSLIWDQVRPLAYLDTEEVELRTFDGRTLRFANSGTPGARELFWDGYIEPFVEELCRAEISAATARAGADRGARRAALHELRVAFVEGFIRLYWLMADIHRLLWPLPHLTRRDTSGEVARMVAFLDTCIASTRSS